MFVYISWLGQINAYRLNLKSEEKKGVESQPPKISDNPRVGAAANRLASSDLTTLLFLVALIAAFFSTLTFHAATFVAAGFAFSPFVLTLPTTILIQILIGPVWAFHDSSF
jgi:hypothetical protein